MPKLDGRKQVGELLLHAHRARVGAACLALPLGELVGDLFVSFVLQKAREKQVAGFEKFDVLDLGRLAPRKEPRGLQLHQCGGDKQEPRGLIQVGDLTGVGDELVSDL